jgi:hypothetical protein
MIKKISLFLLLAGVAGFYACAHMETKSPEDQLLSRVQLEWESKLNADWGAVYDLCCNNYKKQISRNRYLSGQKVYINYFFIENVRIVEPGKGEAEVAYTIRQQGFELDFKSKETWLLEDGKWCLDMSGHAFPMISQ